MRNFFSRFHPRGRPLSRFTFKFHLVRTALNLSSQNSFGDRHLRRSCISILRSQADPASVAATTVRFTCHRAFHSSKRHPLARSNPRIDPRSSNVLGTTFLQPVEHKCRRILH